MQTSYELKTKAKNALRGNYFNAVIAVLICNAIIYAANFITIRNNGGTAIQTAEQITRLSEAIVRNPLIVAGIIGSTAITSVIVTIFVGIPTEVGKIRFFNELSRGNVKTDEVFYPVKGGLSAYLNIVKIGFFKTLYLFLWSLLMVVPVIIACAVTFIAGDKFANSETALAAIIMGEILGMVIFSIPMIVKNYEYMMVEYIVSDNAQISSREAFALSKKMSEGNKFRMFKLQLSFIGWYLLGAMAFGIGILFVIPYMQATFAQLYFELKGERNEPAVTEEIIGGEVL